MNTPLILHRERKKVNNYLETQNHFLKTIIEVQKQAITTMQNYIQELKK